LDTFGATSGTSPVTQLKRDVPHDQELSTDR